MKVPTDRVTPPDEADLFLLGRSDGGTGANPLEPTLPTPVGRPIGEMPNAAPPPPPPPPAGGGMAALDPTRLEKDYGHAL
jgi:pilus assembly protein CpaC